ncbi:PepSY domain-containing protein [Salinimicrobium sp. CDJ15-81-2]|nr:PepSY domain-containing protein [Salinimicrobium nanhaiense]
MKPKKKNKKSPFRKVNDWLHLWLGLFSGIVVFIVSITGCFYAFQQEIKDVIEPWRFVEAQDAAFVPPSVLLDTAGVYMPDKEPTGLTYSNREGAAAVGYHTFDNGKEAFSVVFMNPYTGEFIRKMQTEGSGEFDFFHFILDGHRALWLPHNIGRPIVGIATLIFLFMLISGLIMWWPKKWNKSAYKKSFSIKWNGKFKRVNYDLHNVLGFYSLVFAFIIAVTGLVWSFQWFGNSLYYITSAGETKAAHEHPHSDISGAALSDNMNLPVLDRAFYKVIEQEPDAQGFYMTPVLKDPDDAIEIIAYQDFGTWYDRNEYFFDQYTLERYRTDDDVYVDASFADQLSLLNYDIHVGAVWGLPGKILAFLISLVSASLPVTGFLVWWNKKKKKSNNSAQKYENPRAKKTISC